MVGQRCPPRAVGLGPLCTAERVGTIEIALGLFDPCIQKRHLGAGALQNLSECRVPLALRQLLECGEERSDVPLLDLWTSPERMRRRRRVVVSRALLRFRRLRMMMSHLHDKFAAG